MNPNCFFPRVWFLCVALLRSPARSILILYATNILVQTHIHTNIQTARTQSLTQTMHTNYTHSHTRTKPRMWGWQYGEHGRAVGAGKVVSDVLQLKLTAVVLTRTCTHMCAKVVRCGGSIFGFGNPQRLSWIWRKNQVKSSWRSCHCKSCTILERGYFPATTHSSSVVPSIVFAFERRRTSCVAIVAECHTRWCEIGAVRQVLQVDRGK